MSGTDYRILSTKKIMINYIISGDIAKPDGYFFLKPNIFSDITFLRWLANLYFLRDFNYDFRHSLISWKHFV